MVLQHFGYMTHSVTKSFLSTVIGVAVDQGLIRSVEDTVAKLGGKASPRYAGRPEYASTAAGMMKQHLAELAQFLNDALSL